MFVKLIFHEISITSVLMLQFNGFDGETLVAKLDTFFFKIVFLKAVQGGQPNFDWVKSLDLTVLHSPNTWWAVSELSEHVGHTSLGGGRNIRQV